MKPKYMLDTNVCIYLMKHQPPQVRERFAECFVGDVVISAITLALGVVFFRPRLGGGSLRVMLVAAVAAILIAAAIALLPR